MTEVLRPHDHAEAVAIFRAQMIGPLVCRPLSRGQLAAELRQLSRQPVRPPGAAAMRTYSVPTLERWFYAYRRGGLQALRPQPRSDRGHAQALDDEQRKLLLDIRREHPSASVPLILRTLVADGRLEPGLVSESAVRRLYREHGLDRTTVRLSADERVRRRWEADRPGALWHADVCHGPALKIDGRSVPLRVHAILDDASRYVVAIEAFAAEREVEMLRLLIKALRREGPPDTLYLDNGPTYTGETLATATSRLGITLMHARPHDPQARGKMERFWRTLREGCLDYAAGLGSLHEVQVRLLAFLDRHYHISPHASLMGRSPAQVWDEAVHEREPDRLTEAQLGEALTVRERRRVRGDGTLSVGGVEWELEHGFLAGKMVTVARSLLEPTDPPWVEDAEGRRLALHRVDPKRNATRRGRPRSHKARRGLDAPFDPPSALLAEATGKRPRRGGHDERNPKGGG